MVVQLYTVVRTQIVHLKYVHLIGCNLYIHEGNFFKKVPILGNRAPCVQIEMEHVRVHTQQKCTTNPTTKIPQLMQVHISPWGVIGSSFWLWLGGLPMHSP